MSDNWALLLGRPEIQFPESILAEVARGRRILLTGAGGSIGSALATVLARLGPDRLVLIDAHEASLWRLRQSLEASGFGHASYVLADVRDRPKLERTFRQFPGEVVFHLAAYKHVALAEENVDQSAAVNLIGTLNLIEAATEHQVNAIVLPTTDKTVNPSSLYGCTKRIIERAVRAAEAGWAGSELRVARLVNVLGTQGSVVEVFSRQVEAGLPLAVTDAGTDRYYITMQEAVGYLLGVAAQPEPSGVYLIETGEPIRTVELARRVYRRLRPEATDDGPEIRYTGLKPGERLHEELQYPSEQRRSSRLRSIFALEAPAEAAPIEDWLDELRALRRNLYEWESRDLRAYLFELARAARPDLARATAARGG